MVDWFRIFRRPAEPDYESLLSLLEIKIKARESQLLAIRLRERRANALFITYGVGAWIVYLALWWIGVIGGTEGLERALGGLPVVGGPVAIIFTRRTLRWFYKRREDKEAKTLAELKKEQRDKVEELKKKTGYYSTRNLLEKYDEAIKKNAEARGHPSPSKSSVPSSPSPNLNSNTPLRPSSTNSIRPSAPGTPNRLTPPTAPGTPQQAFPLLPPAASTPVPRTLIDKLADALLGVVPGDGDSPGGGDSKYALICGKCFGHNGLVVKEEFDLIQYQCPRCGYFNPRRNALPTPRNRATSMMHQPTTPIKSTTTTTLGSDNSTNTHRRVKSLHVASNLRDTLAGGNDDEEEDSTGGKNSPRQDDEEEEEVVEKVAVLLEDKKDDSKPRRRKKKDDNDMDTD